MITKVRLSATIAAVLFFAAWHSLQSDIEAQCAGNAACLAASI